MTAGYTPHDLAVLIPVLGRPHHIPPLLASLDATAPGCRVILLVTPGDEAVPACEASGREVVPVRWLPVGDFGRKTNVGYRYTTEPLLFVGATDLEFVPGWFEAATACLATPGIGLVGTNDLCNPRVMAGEHSTHFLVTREYADRYGTIDGPGAVLTEMYVHEYVDDEAVGTAKMRSAWKWAGNSIVKHRHPTLCPGNGEATSDPGYEAQAERMRQSWPVFRRRRRMWDPSAPRGLRRNGARRRAR